MILSLLTRLLLVAVVWIAATEATPAALGYAIVIVPLVVAASYVIVGRIAQDRSLSPRRFVARLRATAALAAWVLARSVVGASDVARRAVVFPRPDIDPQWRTYRTLLSTRGGRVAFALLMNLLPGTLSSRLEADILDVHVIDGGADMDRQLAELERRIARVERAGGAATESA